MTQTDVVLEKNAPPPHDYLFQNSDYAICHYNASQSDITEFQYGPGDREAGSEQIQFMPGGLGNGGHAHRRYTDGGEAIIASGSARVAKFQFVGGRYELINEIVLSEEEHLSEEEIRGYVARMDDAGTNDEEFLAVTREIVEKTGYSSETLPAGMYTVMDRDGFFYAGYGTVIYKIGDAAKDGAASEIEVVERCDVRKYLPKELRPTVTRFFGINLTYDGHLVAALSGIVGVLDLGLKKFSYATTEEEAIDNGVVVDKQGGVFVVTEKHMRKMVWDGEELSTDEKRGAWTEPYDSVQKPGSLSRGSGTTPTLMGYGPGADRLVLIADQGNPVKLVAFWRDEIPKGAKQVEGAASERTAGSIELDFKVHTTIEWSPHVHDYGVMVFNSEFLNPVWLDEENGEMDLLSTMLTVGQTRPAPKGVQRFEWNPKIKEFESQWCNQELNLAWTLSPISTNENVVYLNTINEGLYELVGLDWDSGQEVGKITLGRSVIFNTGGTLISPRPDGSLYVHGFFGPIRVTDIVGTD